MRSAEKLRSGGEGFTLIELLVVVIIVGILAGIAIPVFLNQREQAQDAAAKSTVRNAATALISYQVEYGVFPDGAGDATLDDNPATDDSVTRMYKIQPTVKWTASNGTLVSLNTTNKVGVVPFERYPTSDENSTVFGTRSASGECFYMRIDANGTRYGHDSQCNDPYETSNESRITASGW